MNRTAAINSMSNQGFVRFTNETVAKDAMAWLKNYYPGLLYVGQGDLHFVVAKSRISSLQDATRGVIAQSKGHLAKNSELLLEKLDEMACEDSKPTLAPIPDIDGIDVRTYRWIDGGSGGNSGIKFLGAPFWACLVAAAHWMRDHPEMNAELGTSLEASDITGEFAVWQAVRLSWPIRPEDIHEIYPDQASIQAAVDEEREIQESRIDQKVINRRV